MAVSGTPPGPLAAPPTGTKTQGRRHLALYFPWLPCERVRGERVRATATDPLPEGAPLALVARNGQALRLMAVERDAARHGLAPGMTLADARARCPDLATLPHDPAADAALLTHLAKAMHALTPSVTPDPPDGLLLDISGCAHFFGSEAKMVAKATEITGLSTIHALAGNPAAARALARHGTPAQRRAEDVAALPVSALDLGEAATTALRRAGLKRLGDLVTRPAPTLAARFGEGLVLRLRQVMGDVAAPLAPQPVQAPIRAEARFAEPIARTDDVLEVAEDLLRQVAAQMEQRRLGGRHFALTLHRSDGARRRLLVETGQPTRDPPLVVRLLRERIDSLADPIDPGFGFDAITLSVKRADPLDARQTGLDQSEETQDSLQALIDRLGVRLGQDAVLRLAPADRHMPEAAQVSLPAAELNSSVSFHLPAMPRPLLLFDPPQGIEVIAGVPDGPPLRLRWRGAVHEVIHAEGPERIAPEWWRQRGGHMGEGATRTTRDYYRIEDARGRRLWVFRRGLYDGMENAPSWYVHGLFP
ncbi:MULTISPECIES: DNA polymerase Y family protein [unclassified Novosphingobium]|uniref:Y-family DNA polymerase n=1 Tax=unclassified Novosphingobium TaxID=2644732 RepID=UPI00146E0C2A|nr:MULTISPECIES: DNA polymerase Y family protein [unclassified Novosphingobium]